MQRDVAERPPPLPSDPPAPATGDGPAERLRPPGRSLLLEGVVVYLVLQVLTAAFLPALRSARETFFDDVLLGFFGPERLGRERGRSVSIAWDRPNNAAERDLIEVPEGWPSRMVNYYRISWPRRLAARPAWEYATNAETISGRDGGLMALRTYQEFFAAAVNAKGHLTAGVNLQPPSEWGWEDLDLMGVGWFVTASLPRPRPRSSASTGSGRSTRPPLSTSGSGRPRPWLACTTTWMCSPTRPRGWPGSRTATRWGSGPSSSSPWVPWPPTSPRPWSYAKETRPGSSRGPERRRGAVGAG
jgi:hypothetical protein